MITESDGFDDSVETSGDQFESTCVEMMKYGMLDEYLFKKAIEEICVNSSKSLIDESLRIQNISRLGNFLNKKYIETMNNKIAQLASIVTEDTYYEFKDLIETAVYSVLVVKEESLANEIYLELHEDRLSFDDICLDLEDDQIVEKIQDIGPIFICNVHSVVKKCIRSIQEAKGVSRPVFVQEGWMIIQLKEYNKPPNNSANIQDIAVRKMEEEARLIAEKSLEIFKSSSND